MKVFISYSHEDAAALKRLHVHLTSLKREGRIDTWYDRDILAGGDLDAEISEELETSELFLLLVSPDFLASNYCVEREMQRALERHESGEVRVIPIIVEPCDWASSQLRQLKALPRDGKPVSEWTNENNAYLDIVQELRRLFEVEIKTPAPVPEALISRDTTESRPARRGYRVKRDFDEIDRSDFRETAFVTISEYFQRAVTEIDSIEDLRGRYKTLSSTSFGCTVVNRARDRSTAHITVHNRSTDFAFGDIYYSFEENAASNTTNGAFNIDSDEYDLFFRSGAFGLSDKEEKLTPEQAAKHLWEEFLEQAGVAFD